MGASVVWNRLIVPEVEPPHNTRTSRPNNNKERRSCCLGVTAREGLLLHRERCWDGRDSVQMPNMPGPLPGIGVFREPVGRRDHMPSRLRLGPLTSPNRSPSCILHTTLIVLDCHPVVPLLQVDGRTIMPRFPHGIPTMSSFDSQQFLGFGFRPLAPTPPDLGPSNNIVLGDFQKLLWVARTKWLCESTSSHNVMIVILPSLVSLSCSSNSLYMDIPLCN